MYQGGRIIKGMTLNVKTRQVSTTERAYKNKQTRILNRLDRVRQQQVGQSHIDSVREDESGRAN